ncbi:MAG: hypothetical protein AAGD96_08620 [Chloroflexota bacterium]
MFDQLKIGVATLALGIVMTFGLIATAAPNLPADAETVVTTEQEEPNNDRDGRGGRRDRRGPRDNRAPNFDDDFDALFDF